MAREGEVGQGTVPMTDQPNPGARIAVVGAGFRKFPRYLDLCHRSLICLAHSAGERDGFRSSPMTQRPRRSDGPTTRARRSVAGRGSGECGGGSRGQPPPAGPLLAGLASNPDRCGACCGWSTSATKEAMATHSKTRSTIARGGQTTLPPLPSLGQPKGPRAAVPSPRPTGRCRRTGAVPADHRNQRSSTSPRG